MADLREIEIDKERRDLYAVSIAWIILTLAGAEIGESVSFLVGSIKLNRPWVLWLAGVVAFIYFAWRYYLKLDRTVERFALDVDAASVSTSAYRKVAEQEWRRVMRQAEVRSGDHDFPRGGEQVIKSAENLLASGYVPAPLEGTWLRRIDLQTLHRSGHRPTTDECWQIAKMKRVCETPGWWRVALPTWIRAMAMQRTFSDFMLPIAVAYLAVLSMMVWIVRQL